MLQMPTGAAAQSTYNPQTGQQELPPLSTNPLSINNAPAPNAGSANATQADPSVAFGNSLTQMLQKYQQLGTHAASQLQTGQLNYSDAGLGASNAQLTNPALQGYAPSTIMNAGSQAQQPFNTGAQGLQQTGQAFNEQLSNFGNALGNAKDLMTTYQAQQEKAKTDAQSIVHDAIAAGSDSLAALIQNQPDLVKLAGYTPDTLQGTITGLKKQEALANDSKKQVTTVDLGNRVAVMDNQGNIIRYEPKGTSPGTGNGDGGSNSLTSKQVTRVNEIIKANPGEYGHAADQIDAEFGAGTAQKADTLLKSAYMIPSDALNIVNQYGSPPDLASWNAGQQAFINSHSYNASAAKAAYIKFVPKPAGRNV